MNSSNEKTWLRDKQRDDIRRSQERIFEDAPRREPDSLCFDWEPLTLSDPNLVIFSTEIHCQSERARIRFGIDLSKLQTLELEKLHDILAHRHAGLDDRSSLLRSIEWMLALSLQPSLTETERQDKTRRVLLLIPPVSDIR